VFEFERLQKRLISDRKHDFVEICGDYVFLFLFYNT